MKESKWGTKLMGVHESISIILTVYNTRGAVEGVSGRPSDLNHVHVSCLDRNIACPVEGAKPFLVLTSRDPVDEVDEVPAN